MSTTTVLIVAAGALVIGSYIGRNRVKKLVLALWNKVFKS